jgi:NAD(P)-dependent dehydrogenase (short-subunit alcohol dehydrogenase family)
MADRMLERNGEDRGPAWPLAAAFLVGAALAASALARVRRRYELREKVVLITGGSRGLGLALAREFARRGSRVAICARDSEELERARLDLQGRGARVLALECDVSDRAQVDALIRDVTREWGAVHVLVNNAGVIQVGPLDSLTREDYEDAMRTHFWGPLNTILAVLPQMRERSEGRIVNVSSIGGKISVPHLLPYSASKFALTGLSEGLRAELARDNVLVTTVCPGLMRTGSPRNALFKGKHHAEYAWFSIADATPAVSTSAESAARRIVDACRDGDAELIFPTLTRLAVGFEGLFPGATAEILSQVNRALPDAGGVGTERVRGAESQSRLSPSPLTALGDRAAARNNELG